MNNEQAWTKYAAEAEGIPGWFQPAFVPFIRAINGWQCAHDVVGAILEIGVHHGRSFIPLALCAREAERLVAVDCFRRKEANRSWSGAGDLEAFRVNLERYLPAEIAKAVTIVERDARELTAGDYRTAAGGRVRMAHVDGGHSYNETLNDLDNMAAVLVTFGALLIDDVFNPHWPDVGAAFHDWLFKRTDWVPIATAHAHVVVVHHRHAAEYQGALRALGPIKTTTWNGRHVCVW